MPAVAPGSLALVWRRRLTHSGLTARQQEIMALVARGYTNEEIGDTLFLTEQTVKNHLTRILEQTETQCRAHAVLAILGVQPGSAIWRQRLARTTLSPRQCELLTALADPHALAAGAALGMARATLRNHCTTIYRKLGARGWTHAVMLVLGLAEPVDRSYQA